MKRAVTNPRITKPSFFQRRKEIRFELHKQRMHDNDMSEARMLLDAIELDTKLVAEGYKLKYETEWARTRTNIYPQKAIQADMADFLSLEVC